MTTIKTNTTSAKIINTNAYRPAMAGRDHGYKYPLNNPTAECEIVVLRRGEDERPTTYTEGYLTRADVAAAAPNWMWVWSGEPAPAHKGGKR